MITIIFLQGGLEFEKIFVTFFWVHAPFYRSMGTFLVNFLKVFSQDHLGKRLPLNHNANQWYMNTLQNVLYQWYLLRCQTENTNQGFVHCTVMRREPRSAHKSRRRKLEMVLPCSTNTDCPVSCHLWICSLCASFITACQQYKHILVRLNCI